TGMNIPTGIQLAVRVYKLNPNNLLSPKTNVLTHTQTVTNFLNYPASAVTFTASTNAGNPDTYVYVEIEASGSINADWKQFDNAFEPKLKKLSNNSVVHIVPKYDMN